MSERGPAVTFNSYRGKAKVISMHAVLANLAR